MVNKVNVVPAKPKKRKTLCGPSSRSQQNLFHLLKNCKTVTNLSQTHAQIILNGFAQKPFLLSKLLCLYISHGLPYLALAASKPITEPSTTLWNQIIRAHSLTAEPWRSIQSFKTMVASSQARPDGFSYSFLLGACVKSESIRVGEQVHCRILVDGFCSSVFVSTNLVNLYSSSDGVFGAELARQVFDEIPQRSLVTWNALLKAYSKRGDIDNARRVFDEMPERSIVSWTTLIWGCARSGQWREAISLFHRMRRSKIGLDQVAMLAALSACAELGDLQLGSWIHRRVEEKLRSVSVSLSNALVHMYARCSAIDQAYSVFESMTERTTASWSTIVTALARQGRGGEALVMFRRMLDGRSVSPDEITFIGALSACSHSGLVNEGLEIFEFMTRHLGIRPWIEHYGCVVDLLSRAGFLDEARGVIGKMPMKPGLAVWGALLNGCRVHGNAEVAMLAAEQLAAQLAPDQAAAGYLVLLSNIFALDQRWRDVGIVRLAMVESGIRKPPGMSWIRLNGAVHGFVADDTSHLHSKLIRKTLLDIATHSQKESSEEATSISL